MYTLDEIPSTPVRGPLGPAGDGVIGVKSGGRTVRLFPGALVALQEIAAGKYPGMRASAASEAGGACCHLAASPLRTATGVWFSMCNCAGRRINDSAVVCQASSADTPRAVQCARAAMAQLEVVSHRRIEMAAEHTRSAMHCCHWCNVTAEQDNLAQVPGLTFEEVPQTQSTHC